MSLHPFGNVGILNFSKKNLFVLPDDVIDELKKHFDSVTCQFSNNALNEIPEEIKLLPFLQRLDFSFNNLKTVKNLKYIKFLEYLDISNNQLSEFEIELSSLESLKVLNISYNKIKTMPDRINDLKLLEVLKADHNRIVSFSDSFCKLESLITLSLKGNIISALPKNLSSMVSLQTLDVSFNRITTLESDIYKLSQLNELIIEGNPIIFPPASICALGYKAIMNHISKMAVSRDLPSNYSVSSVPRLYSKNLPTPYKNKTPYRSKRGEEEDDSVELKVIRNLEPQVEIIKKTFSEKLNVTITENQSIFGFLSDGVNLCRLVKLYNLHVDTIFLPTKSETPYFIHRALHNIQSFVKACQTIGINNNDMCSEFDILSGKPNRKIILTVAGFINKMESKYLSNN